MQIFVITHDYPLDDKDMSGIFIKNLLNDLPEFDFHVCAIRYGSTMHKLYRNPANWYKLLSYFIRASHFGEQEFTSARFDLIWAHWWLPPGIIATRLSRKFKCPQVVTCHGTDAFMLRNHPVLRPLAKRVFHQTRIVNVVSHYMATITTQNSTVINMPYNQEVFNYHQEPRDDCCIICPSAFIKRKNLNLLIKAVAPLSNLKLKIFGSGPLKDEIQALSAPYGHIELHPSIDQKQLAEEYKKAGAVILPSLDEGFGLTLVEGAACGCVPMATIDGGMVEIINQVGGVLFPFDPTGDSIRKVIKNYLNTLPVDRMKIAKAAKVYSRAQIIPKFRQLLIEAADIHSK